MAELSIEALAARLVADLMPIAVAVAGPDAALVAAALGEAGAAAEVARPGVDGFDLALLLVPREARPDAALVAPLAACSDRILLIPWPPGAPRADTVDGWFELFAEDGFQPVVEYDAAFLGAGAFLVDRNATAAEDELQGFVERVAQGAEARGADEAAPAAAARAP